MSQIKVDSIVPRGGLPSGASGGVIQVKSTVKKDTFSQSLNANTVSNDMGLNVTITPQSSSSKILLIVQTTIGLGTDDHVGFVVLRGGSLVPDYFPSDAGNRTTFASGGTTRASSYPGQISGCFLDNPSTTSATTYSVRLKYGRGANDQTIFLNRANNDDNAVYRQRTVSTLTCMEVSG